MMNRRQIIPALAAMGAVIDLPLKATAAQVDECWAALQSGPWILEVDECGTLREAGERVPERWRDIVWDIAVTESMTREAFIAEVQCCGPLALMFDEPAASEMDDHPGSSHIAARLHNDVDDANRVAAELQLPFRIREASRG